MTIKIFAVLTALCLCGSLASDVAAQGAPSPAAAGKAAAPAKARAAKATRKAGAAKGGTITGIDKIHAQVRVGNRVCMADHDHNHEASMPSRKGAETAAIRNWQIFTADEYGTAWGKYSLSVSQKMTCSEGGGRWSCRVVARPCRPA